VKNLQQKKEINCLNQNKKKTILTQENIWGKQIRVQQQEQQLNKQIYKRI